MALRWQAACCPGFHIGTDHAAMISQVPATETSDAASWQAGQLGSAAGPVPV